MKLSLLFSQICIPLLNFILLVDCVSLDTTTHYFDQKSYQQDDRVQRLPFYSVEHAFSMKALNQHNVLSQTEDE
eukprot:Pgem_evm1s15577